MEDNIHNRNYPVNTLKKEETLENVYPRSLTIFPEMLSKTSLLSDADFRRYLQCCIAYVTSGSAPDENSETFAVLLCFDFAKDGLDRQIEKYRKRYAASCRNGALGGRPRKENPAGSSGNKNNPVVDLEDENNPVAFFDAKIDENNPVAPQLKTRNKKLETTNKKLEIKNKKQVKEKNKKKETQGCARSARLGGVFAEEAEKERGLLHPCLSAEFQPEIIDLTRAPPNQSE